MWGRKAAEIRELRSHLSRLQKERDLARRDCLVWKARASARDAVSPIWFASSDKQVRGR